MATLTCWIAVVITKHAFRLTCSSQRLPGRLVSRPTSTTITARRGTTNVYQLSSVSLGEPVDTSDDGGSSVLWIIGLVTGCLVFIASVVAVIAIYIRRKRRQVYERPLPRRQREITMYTGIIPEALRNRNLTDARNSATLSRIYNEVDERRLVDLSVEHPGQSNDYLELIAPPPDVEEPIKQVNI
ncbi:hypothetical protein BaRGS_00035247 [Batillaria attramentaria]|uniref:Uncharacterized protein n=1 Tax=Batillaria attramentaria TaxID=370345 RepID=A0ABD0JFE4_9CAEN